MKTPLQITHLFFGSLLFSLSFLLLSCGSTGKLPTPSGRPEVTILHTTAQKVKEGLAAWLPAQGKTIIETGEFTITTSPKNIYTIVQSGADVILYEATFKIVGDYSLEYTGQSDYENTQKELEQIAEFMKGR